MDGVRVESSIKRHTTFIIPKILRLTTAIFTEMSLFCHKIGVKNVQVAGIIAEYNPLHRGHLFQMAQLRRRLGQDCAVVCAMSGNFVQRGDFAIVRKHVRAEAAVCGGADLVLELPLPWAISSAEGFAEGGVQVLSATGVVDYLAFGSECGDTDRLRRAAEALLEPEFSARLQERLRRGESFAAARQRVLEDCLGISSAAVLSAPNDILGVEYCKALLRQGSPVQPMALRRAGPAHDGGTEGAMASASAIRKMLAEDDSLRACGFMTEDMAALYRAETAAGRAPVQMQSCQRAILANLRRMTAGDFQRLDEGREGLGNRFFAAAQSAVSLEQLLDSVKTKRYAYARLRRMLLWSYLGWTPEQLPRRVPYLRVLAANQRGRELLGTMRRTAALPVLTKPADVRRLDAEAQRLFQWEVRATDLYTLAFPSLKEAAGQQEWKTGPVIL